MSEPKLPKKSESIEVRIAYPTKLALMDRARAEGRAASEVVREQIDRYLRDAARAPADGPVPARRWPLTRRYLALVALLPILAGGLVAIVSASAPAAAQPELKRAFAALDANEDGAISRDEFIHPVRAHEMDLRGSQAGLGQPLVVGGTTADAAYVRYVLTAAAGDADIVLLIAVAPPPPGNAPADQMERLASDAFDRLDRNGDQALSLDEVVSP